MTSSEFGIIFQGIKLSILDFSLHEVGNTEGGIDLRHWAWDWNYPEIIVAYPGYCNQQDDSKSARLSYSSS